MTNKPKFTVSFFKTSAGNEPVHDWLKSLSADNKKIVGEDIRKVQIVGPQIGKPTVDGFGDGLYEIRSTLSNGEKARILFTVSGISILLLSHFIKKTRATPKHEKDLAKQRLAEAKRTKQA